MKRKLFSCFAAVCFLAVTFSAYGQSLDFNLTGSGARAAGMGQAFIGVSDDATAITWNPAGLTQLERPEASLVNRFVADVIDDTDDDFDLENNHFVLNFGSAAYPFDVGGKKLVVAVAYQRQLDFFVEEKFGADVLKIEGGADSFTPGLAYQLMPIWSLGATANIWFGNPEATFQGDKLFEWEFSGLNFTFGTMLDLNWLEDPIPLKIGAVVRTPFDLEDSADDPIDYGMPLMMGFGASYRFGDSFTLAADYELRQFGDSKVKFEGGSVPLTDHEENLSQIRVGAEYLIIADFAVIPVRAGFKTVPTLVSNFDATGDVDDKVSGTGFSIGSGLIFERFALDVAWERQSYEQDDAFFDFTTETIQNIVTFSGIIYF